MASTFSIGDQLRLQKIDTLHRNDVISYKLPNMDKPGILRVVGLPGDEILIDSGIVYVNGNKFTFPHSSREVFVVYCEDPYNFQKLKKYNFSNYSLNYSFFSLNKKEFKEIQSSGIPDSIYKIIHKRAQIDKKLIFNSGFKFRNRHFFGPLVVPKLGNEITENILNLTPNTLNRNDLGKIITEDFFFCLGDNLPEADDSRVIGLIAKSSLIGKVVD